MSGKEQGNYKMGKIRVVWPGTLLPEENFLIEMQAVLKLLFKDYEAQYYIKFNSLSG
jgi:hypothetical protein